MAKVSLRAYNHEIEAMIDRGHLDEAIAHCRHILKSFPKHIDTYRLLGKAYLEYKRYAEAADIFSRVLVSVPNDFVANVGLSIIRDEENKLDEAIWHMERAFETQPSNAAIQSEMQRLYGRREGVAPPRIRMTRGALAQMYVQGELYPQAISEIKSVLKEDSGRTDMQVLLARAYYRSGLKNDAAEVASAVLRTHPYNLDANRVLLEILGVDKPESAQIYRQRVVELDPYAAQVTSSVFSSNEVPDAAVALEHLDWNGQPVGMAPDWEANQAISTESGPAHEEQPDWLKNAFGGTAMPAQSAPFDAAPPSARPAEPAEEIPDFLRAAGWGQATGAFDESKSAFADNEPVPPAQHIEQGDLPDWVKAMAPKQAAETPAEEEELPDWINKIGTSALPVSSEASDQPDLMMHLDQPTVQSQPVDDQPDWLKGLGETEPPAVPASASADVPDWLKGLGSETAPTPAAASTDDLDWLTQFDNASSVPPVGEDLFDETRTQLETPSPASEEFDLFVDRGPLPQATPAAADDFDFLNPLGSQSTPAAASSDDFDFLNELAQESEQLAPSSTTEPSHAGPLGMSEEEQDDSFAWLENLAAKQGATEGLLTTPEERLEEEPDWVKQVKGMDASQEPPTQPRSVIQPAANLEQLGKSEQEQDDSFAWLESLAAKQGATEGLLTKPEERLEEEPEWVQQAKTLGTPPQDVLPEHAPEAEQPAVTEPIASTDQLGKSEQERDDAFAWLESLAAKQGATEGLLTQPEERLEEAPDWVQQAATITEQPQELTPEQALEEQRLAVPEPSASVEELGKSEQERDDAFAWLESLAAKQGASEGLLTQPDERPAEEPEWVRQAKDVGEQPVLATESEQSTSIEDTQAWLRSLDEEQAPAPEARSQEEQTQVPEWLAQDQEIRAEELPSTAPVAEQPAPVDEADAWLRNLEGEATPASQEEQIPEWMTQEQDVRIEDLSPVEPVAQQPARLDETELWLRSLEGEKTSAPQEQEMRAKEVPSGEPVAEQPAAIDDTEAWLKSLDEDAAAPLFESSPADDTALWIKTLDAREEATPQPAEAAPAEELPAWMQTIEEPETPAPEAAAPAVAEEAAVDSEWLGEIHERPEQPEQPVTPTSRRGDTGELPDWLRELDKEEESARAFASDADLPAWLRDETGEVVAEPIKIEPTRATDWQRVHAEAQQPEPEPEAVAQEPAAPAPPPPTPEPVDMVAIIEEKMLAAEQKPEVPVPSVKPRKDVVRKVTGMLGDPVLGTARSELSRNNISGALENYGRLIRKGRFLEDIIYDLREASYRYPVDVDIWQSLGDAYMRANRLQDALEAYTKAEELLR